MGHGSRRDADVDGPARDPLRAGERGGRAYQDIVLLGEIPEFGPNLVASTHVGPADDYELARAVLDEMMERLTFAVAPPGASSENPPIEAPSISMRDTTGDFRLDLVVDQDRYRAGQPIQAYATLTYLGSAPSVTLWGSGTGILGIGARQLDGPIDPGGASTTDCVAYGLTPDEPRRVGPGSQAASAHTIRSPTSTKPTSPIRFSASPPASGRSPPALDSP
ncbi:hypothetical protein BH24CHL10_BH24CHL10_05690 [soil metagenome]